MPVFPVKYPRTPHAPWSPGRTPDDEVLADLDHLVGREVVVSVKMDGENVSLYRDASPRWCAPDT
jgi:hypothetical protein